MSETIRPDLVQGRPILVRASWDRPPYCKDDWCRIRLHNGYHYWSPKAVVEFDGPRAWIHADHVWDLEDRDGCEVRFTDYDGEGCLDWVPRGFIREIPPD